MSVQDIASGAEEVAGLMDQALITRSSGDPPARFALCLRDDQTPDNFVHELHRLLPNLKMIVTPLSSLDLKTVVIEIPDKALHAHNPAIVFAASYALATATEAAAVEPDLPTAIFPESLPKTAVTDSTETSLDDILSECWSPKEPALNGKPTWVLEAIRANQAWQVSEQQGRPSKGKGIIIAQPDTGITKHAELQDVKFVPGFNFLENNDDPTDPLTGTDPGHGTATASVMVSPTTPLITGSAPEAMHMPLRAIESVVQITQVTVARSIDWAIDHGAAVITMSLGGLPSFTLHSAIRRAVEADVIVLAAAGNCVRTVVWPARYEECLAVAGTNAADSPWQGSCTGTAVDVSAPAQNVLHAYVPTTASVGGNHVSQGQGTSFAVALTAGVAALWLAHHGRESLITEAKNHGETLQTMFRRLLQNTCRQPGKWKSSEMGAGIIDAEALLRADLQLGRERQSIPFLPCNSVSGTDSVVSLITETLGYNAMQFAGKNWQQYEQELALALMDEFLVPRDGFPKNSSRPKITQNLAHIITDDQLKQRLRIAS